MPLKFNRQKLRETRQTSWLVLDLAMVFLVLVNLAFIIFDTVYATGAVQSALDKIAPAFNRFYADQIHANFIFYDLVFVAIFVAEFCFQWVMAVKKQAYARWYFYPFLHWYDLIGLIPIGSLRLLRLLRIISLLVRLQKMGIVDLANTRPYKFIEFYFNVFIDEVSDRVILRTLNDVKREIENETPVTRQIITEVIAPQKEALVAHLSRRIGTIADRSYQHHQASIQQYVESVVAEAVEADQGIRTLERVPVLGKALTNTLRRSINDIVYEVFDRAVRDISAAENNALVDETVSVIIDSILEDHPELGDIGTRITLEALEVIKERVRVQHWKSALDQSPAVKTQTASAA
ncbi:MAG: hypothetical protein ACNA8J_03090 [Gammaproteobacteria bacterium]